MQGLYGGGISILHTRCSAQTLVAKAMEEEDKKARRRRHITGTQEHGLSNSTCATSSFVCVGTIRTL
jgi:hypothetical protein